jgi:hypothetical protein
MRVLQACLAAVAWCTIAQAQPLATPYHFHLGGGTDIDTGLVPLPRLHAAARGRVRLSDDGHLVYADGTRCRLYGTTVQFGGCFPDQATADVLAKKFRSLGYNCVRFSYMDNTWFPGASIIGAGDVTGPLSPEGMARLDYFVHALEQQGIHPTFTMHGAWQPKPQDGIPDTLGWGTRTPLMLDERVQNIQRNIMKKFLEHVNPHTGLAYKDDPAIPFITVAEDVSFTVYWLYTKDVDLSSEGSRTVGLSQLARYDAAWNDWLRRKYGSTEALRQAWRVAADNAVNLLQNPGFEDPFSSAWQFNADNGAGVQALSQFSEADKTNGEACMRVRISRLAPQPQSFQINLVQQVPNIQRGQYYRLRFDARTTQDRGSRSLIAAVMSIGFPYNNVGLAVEPRLTSAWQTFEYTFMAEPTNEAITGLIFLMGADSGDVFLDEVSIVAVGHPGVLPDEDLSRGNVRRAPYRSQPPYARMRDQMAFYEEKLDGLFGRILRMVRDTLKSSVLLCPSNLSYSFFDHHVAKDYEVSSTSDRSGANDPYLTNQYGTSVGFQSQFRRHQRAFVLQSGSLSFPNPAQTEMATIWPSYAGVQDWDGVFGGVHTTRAELVGNRIDSNGFDAMESKPHILALTPWSATVMRGGLVSTPTRSIVIDVAKDVLQSPNPRIQQPYGLSIYTDSRMALFRPVAVSMDLAEEESVLPHREVSALVDNVDVRNLNADNDQVFLNAQQGHLRVVTPRAVAVSGPLVGEIFNLGGIQVEQISSVRHATVTIHALDSMPLGTGGDMLVTVASRVANEGATFEGATLRNIGPGSLRMEGNNVRVTLPALADAESVTATPLGADGLPKGAPITATRRTNGRFAFELSTATAATPWFKIQYRMTTSSVDEERDNNVRLMNNDEDIVAVAKGRVRLTITDIRGAIVADVTGVESVAVSTSVMSAGAYYAVAVDAHGGIRRMPIVVAR